MVKITHALFEKVWSGGIYRIYSICILYKEYVCFLNVIKLDFWRALFCAQYHFKSQAQIKYAPVHTYKASIIFRYIQ